MDLMKENIRYPMPVSDQKSQLDTGRNSNLKATENRLKQDEKYMQLIAYHAQRKSKKEENERGC